MFMIVGERCVGGGGGKDLKREEATERDLHLFEQSTGVAWHEWFAVQCSETRRGPQVSITADIANIFALQYVEFGYV